ncbi:MAG: hypothetical protein EPO55_20155 [Reyranella sp.]|uniref:hypothetical protein n=1 Tax=Reyranella sp. TaxID=1929291 RepID=UPI00121FF5BC|nr:hypothetical protein [Reyranella sp.]TAJ36841.1 MAG: hypothetical protein EPO55_20155 [Reyranella sp.]
MAGHRRNYAIAAGLVVLLAIGAQLLPSALWACGLAVLLGLAGVVLLRGNRWRTGALLATALAVSLALLDAVAGFLSPAPMGRGLVQTTDPKWWPPPDPTLGFRPLPSTKVIATATFGPELVYRQTYHFDGNAARVTPAGPAGGDTYLFLGDSFVFGQGLADDQSLAAQFAKANDYTVRTVNLGVPGYGPNHLVRALEAGLLDRYADQSVKAVVSWIIPAHLARVTGNGSWLGSSPRYVLDKGVPRHTGTFNEYRWTHPLAGLKYLLGEQFQFVDAIGMRQRQEEQADLFVALMVRLQQLSREKFGAPLIVVYSWPDEVHRKGYGDAEFLIAVLNRLRQAGIALLSVDNLTSKIDMSLLLIPHDGHPTAYTYELIAGELKRRLAAP